MNKIAKVVVQYENGAEYVADNGIILLMLNEDNRYVVNGTTEYSVEDMIVNTINVGHALETEFVKENEGDNQ